MDTPYVFTHLFHFTMIGAVMALVVFHYFGLMAMSNLMKTTSEPSDPDNTPQSTRVMDPPDVVCDCSLSENANILLSLLFCYLFVLFNFYVGRGRQRCRSTRSTRTIRLRTTGFFSQFSAVVYDVLEIAFHLAFVCFGFLVLVFTLALGNHFTCIYIWLAICFVANTRHIAKRVYTRNTSLPKWYARKIGNSRRTHTHRVFKNTTYRSMFKVFTSKLAVCVLTPILLPLALADVCYIGHSILKLCWFLFQLPFKWIVGWFRPDPLGPEHERKTPSHSKPEEYEPDLKPNGRSWNLTTPFTGKEDLYTSFVLDTITHATILCRTRDKATIFATLLAYVTAVSRLGILDGEIDVGDQNIADRLTLISTHICEYVRGLNKDEIPPEKKYDASSALRPNSLTNSKWLKSLLSVCGLIFAVVMSIKDATFSIESLVSTQKVVAGAFDNDGIKLTAGLVESVRTVVVGVANYLSTGDWSLFTHSASDYDKLLERYSHLKAQFKDYNEVSLLNADHDKFVGDVNSLYSDVTAMYNVSRKIKAKNARWDMTKIASFYGDVACFYQNVKAKVNIMSMNRVPFSALVYSGPEVGKTNIMNDMIRTFCSVYDKVFEDRYIFKPNTKTTFDDAYEVYMHTCVLDDIACFRPEQVSGLDSSLDLLLRWVGNFATMANDAVAEFKGTKSMRFDFLVASTNILHFNSKSYFATPAAAVRRFPYVVIPVVKKEFSKNPDSPARVRKIDPSACNEWSSANPGHPACFHTYSVYKVRVGEGRGDMPRGVQEDPMPGVYYEPVLEDGDTRDFIRTLAAAMKKHKEQQDGYLEAIGKQNKIPHCKECHLPVVYCECNVQDGKPMEVPLGVVVGEPESPSLSGSGDDCDVYVEAIFEEGSFPRIVEKGIVPNSVTMPMSWNTPEYQPPNSLSPEANMVMVFTSVVFLLSMVIMLMKWTRTKMCDALDGIVNEIVIRLNGLFGFYARRVQRRALAQLRAQVHATFPALRFASKIAATAVLLGAAYSLYNMTREVGVEPHGVGQSAPEPVDEQVVTKPAERNNAWANIWSKPHVDYTHTSRCALRAPEEDFARAIHAATITISVRCGDEVETVSAIGIRPTIFATVSHAFNKVRDDELIEIRSTGVGRDPAVFTLRPEDWICKGELLLFRTPRVRVTCLDKYLTTQSPSGGPYEGTTYRRRLVGQFSSEVSSCVSVGFIKRVVDFAKEPGCGIISQKPAEYYVGIDRDPALQGDCGSPLVVNTGSAKVLVGIHVAGNDQGKSIAVPIDRNTVDSLLKEFPAQPKSLSWKFHEMVEPDLGPGVHVGPLYERAPICKTDEPLALRANGTAKNDDGTRAVRGITRNSSVQKSLFYENMEEAGLLADAHPPVVSGSRVKLNYLKKATTDVFPNMPLMTLGIIADFLAEKWAKSVDFAAFGVLSDHETINGRVGDPFLDGMKMSSGSGRPFLKKKFDLADRLEDHTGAYYAWKPEVSDYISECREKLANGVGCGFTFNGFFKDEPVSKKKVETESTRIICGAPVALHHLTRQYFLPILAELRRKGKWESAMGVNAQSKEWAGLYKRATRFGGERNIAGDFKGYDWSVINIATTRVAFGLLYLLAKMSGKYSERSLTIMRGLISEICYANLDFFGEILGIMVNPSGQPTTTEINCIVVSLIFRVAYLSIVWDVKIRDLDEATFTHDTQLALRQFDEHVELINYGDDNVLDTDDERFNFGAIKRKFAEANIVYTDTDKTEKDFAYQNITEVSFLRRKFRVALDAFGNQQVFAPLELDSIHKSMTRWVPGELPPRLHGAALLAGHMRELAMYPEEVFDKYRKFFTELVHEHGLAPMMPGNDGSLDFDFPSYKDYHTAFFYQDADNEFN